MIIVSTVLFYVFVCCVVLCAMAYGLLGVARIVDWYYRRKLLKLETVQEEADEFHEYLNVRVLRRDT